MRKFCYLLLLLSAVSHAEPSSGDRGGEMGRDIQGMFSSGHSLEEGLLKPLNSDKKLSTIDGETEFDADVGCASQAWALNVAMQAGPNNNVGQITAYLDMDNDGTINQTSAVNGPFAAVCTNGLLSCTDDSATNCTGKRWVMNGMNIGLQDVTKNSLGGCYCVNDSCGDSLLQTNSEKIIGDIGVGISKALEASNPRLTTGDLEYVSPSEIRFLSQDSHCSVEDEPEQYFNSPGQISSQGQNSASSDPMYQMLLESPAAEATTRSQQDCKIDRVIELEQHFDVNEIITFNSQNTFSRKSCGVRCERYTLGDVGPRTLSSGCGGWDRNVNITVHKPDRIESARLTYIFLDDHVYTSMAGEKLFSWPDWWDGKSQYCADTRNRDQHFDMDITRFFTDREPDTTFPWYARINVVDLGGFWAQIEVRYKDDCKTKTEYFNDTCSALEANNDCAIKEERTDGVLTVENHYKTEQEPAPSTRVITYNGCSQEYERPFWKTERSYICESEEGQDDLSYAADRYETIHGSFDPSSGNFNDKRTNENGSSSFHAMNSPIVPPQDDSCMTVCKVSKERPGIAMGENGPVSNNNNTGAANDFDYRECRDNVCPLGDGETMVSDCNCNSNFVEAFSTMQTIRMMQQDFLCVP